MLRRFITFPTQVDRNNIILCLQSATYGSCEAALDFFCAAASEFSLYLHGFDSLSRSWAGAADEAMLSWS